MKAYINRTIAAIFAMSLAVSCGTFDELSKNPYALYQAPAESFVQPILFKYGSTSASIFRNTIAPMMQYTVSTNTEQTSKIVGNYNIPESVDDDTWVGLYTQYGNAVYMEKQAEKEDNPAMLGVALILKSLIISTIADTYGNVPYFEAGQITLQQPPYTYTTKYDNLKDIYLDIFCMLEKANRCFADSKSVNFAALCDYMYNGNVAMWQRFGNALYLRLLNRVGLKAVEESNGALSLPDGSIITVSNKMREMYDCWLDKSGNYPMYRSIEDGAFTKFDETEPNLQSPFYSTTSGIWTDGGTACETLLRAMSECTEGTKQGKRQEWTYYSVSASNHYDPRHDCFFYKLAGSPTQLRYEDMTDFRDVVVSSAGNSLLARMPSGQAGQICNSVCPDKKLTFSLQNPARLPLLPYSEILFIFAEAGARGWIDINYFEYVDLWKQAVISNIMEWRTDITSPEYFEINQYMEYISEKINVDNALEQILTQKWIACFFLANEGWNDYRRTGYPLLKTNGPAAENDQILPTRMRYPADELYRNQVNYTEQVNGWLGGSDNMQTDVWWADTAISRELRLKGRL